MSSLNNVGLGLSVVFTCLLLALLAEIYYLLWWKNRFNRRDFEQHFNNPSREISYSFCWKTQSSSSSVVNISRNLQIHPNDSTNKDHSLQSKAFDGLNGGVTGAEFLTGLPRFLFTINEETKEDMNQSEDDHHHGKRNCLDDLMKNSTPYVTPFSSPTFLTPVSSCHSSVHSNNGVNYNPFHEASNDAEFSRIVKSSPPPKFKFLRDAEEKLQRKTLLIERAKSEGNLFVNKGNQDGSFITIIVAKNQEIDKQSHRYHSPQCHSSCSASSSATQVLPLASSTRKKPKSFLNK